MIAKRRQPHERGIRRDERLSYQVFQRSGAANEAQRAQVTWKCEHLTNGNRKHRSAARNHLQSTETQKRTVAPTLQKIDLDPPRHHSILTERSRAAESAFPPNDQRKTKIMTIETKAPGNSLCSWKQE